MAKIKKVKKQYWLILILVLSFFLRFYNLSELPYGFNGDEAAVGYYAYSLGQNLSDEFGNKLPLYFPSIGDYKFPGYPYLSIVPVALFGLSVFSARFLSAFLGSLFPLVIYYLTIELFNKKDVAIVAALMAAVSPFSIILSRGAHESNVAMFFLTLGVLGLLLFLRKKERIAFSVSLIAFLISIFTYPSVRVFLLLFLPFIYLGLITRKKATTSHRRLLNFLIGITLLVAVFSLIDPRGRVRANDIGILRDPWPKEYLADSIHEDGLAFEGKNILITRIFHNKLTAYGLDIAERYLEHFDPVYLFIQSNPDMPKYSVPNVGLFYFFEAVTLILGIVALAKIRKGSGLVIGLWILLSVVPSSITIETPSPTRALIGLPGWIMLSALGIWYLLQKTKKSTRPLFSIVFGLVVIAHVAYFWHQYSIHDVYRRSWYLDEGAQKMVLAVNELEGDFDKVVISGDPYIFFLFFNKVKPQDFLKDSEILPEEIGKWERVERFGKIIFKMSYQCPKIGRQNVLYVCQGEEIPQNSILHKVVRFKDGKPAYLLVEFVPYSERESKELPERVHYMVETDLYYEEALLPEDSGRYW
jgi:4-amino-4-deoxy-L-arabinose transferase-like glycosyltransferase